MKEYKIPQPLITTGDVIITRLAKQFVEPEDVAISLFRHERSDWGNLSKDDWFANENSLPKRRPLVSCYRDRKGTGFLIETDATRQITKVSLFDEDGE